MPWSSFSECWALSQLFHSPLSLSSRSCLVLLHLLLSRWYHLHIWGYWYFSWQSCFQFVLHPAHNFHDILHINKQGDSMQPWHTPCPIWNQSVLPCPVLTVASRPAYRFLRRQVRWSGIPISWRIFHSLLWSTQSKALASSIKQKWMFFWNSLAFCIIQWMLAIWSLVPLPFLNTVWTSEISPFMYCWGLAWRILTITLLACEMSATVQSFEHSLVLLFLGIGMKTDLFQSCGHCWVFQISWHIECSTFTASSFRIWNSSTGIPSPPLALFTAMLPKAHLTLHSCCCCCC